MSPGPLAPQERPRKKYTARSYSRRTLRPPNRYSARAPRIAVTIMSIAAPPQAGKASTITAAPWPPPMQVEGDAGAGRRQRVTDRDRAAIDVGFGAVEPQLFLDREVLRCERFVHLDQVHLFQLHPGLLERFAGRRRRPDPHVLGLDPYHRPRDEPAEGLEAVRFGELLACDHRSRGAVHDPGGVAGGDEPVLFEVRLEAQQHLQRRL